MTNRPRKDDEVAAPPALSYEGGPATQPLLGETIGANLRRSAALHPDRDALVSVHQGVWMSYADLDRAVDGLGCKLIEMGISRGDRVALWSPNCIEWVLIQYATARVGAILVSLNPAYRAAEVRYALAQSQSKLLLTAERFKSSDYTAMIEDVRHELPDLEQWVVLGSAEWEGMREPATADSIQRLRQVEAALQFDDPINIQFTSGTTGSPKGATLTHHNILNNGYFIAQTLHYGENDRVCIPVPFYHCFGMVVGNLACTSVGACMVLPAPSFEPVATLEAVAAERCTSLYGVPTMFIAELELEDFEDYDLSSLRTGVMAGSACPIEVMKEVAARMNMHEVTICYGMTETSPVSTQTSVEDSLERRVSTVGRAHPHVEIKIVDPESGALVPRGEAGEFCTRGYSVMRGYWREPELTREAIDAGGWMHTGDLATMDAEGYVRIVGRIKDMIIRGGENVYPREVEELLHEHHSVADVQVIGVPDATLGEEIMAWVIPKPKQEVTEGEILTVCRENLAHFKVPRYVRIVAEFPTTVTGKVQKYKLRERAIDELQLSEAIRETA